MAVSSDRRSLRRSGDGAVVLCGPRARSSPFPCRSAIGLRPASTPFRSQSSHVPTGAATDANVSANRSRLRAAPLSVKLLSIPLRAQRLAIRTANQSPARSESFFAYKPSAAGPFLASRATAARAVVSPPSIGCCPEFFTSRDVFLDPRRERSACPVKPSQVRRRRCRAESVTCAFRRPNKTSVFSETRCTPPVSLSCVRNVPRDVGAIARSSTRYSESSERATCWCVGSLIASAAQRGTCSRSSKTSTVAVSG